jgi:hypothetical protein
MLIRSDACTINIINDACKIAIDDSRAVFPIVASLTDSSKDIIYDCYMFIVPATSETS